MFEGNRVITQRNHQNGRMEWYFQAREGLIGPFESEARAEECLNKFIEHRIRLGLDGGRSGKKGGTSGESAQFRKGSVKSLREIGLSD